MEATHRSDTARSLTLAPTRNGDAARQARLVSPMPPLLHAYACSRRLKRERWTFDRPKFDIDAKGVGVAVYSAHGPERSYSLVCFAHDLPADQRSDRVIAEAWDSTFTLFDGEPYRPDDIERLSWNVPKQEAGRISDFARSACPAPTARSVCSIM